MADKYLKYYKSKEAVIVKIENSSVIMTGESRHIEIHTKEESLKTWGMKSKKTSLLEQKGVMLDLSDEGKALKTQMTNINNTKGTEFNISDRDKERIFLLQMMIESLTGKKLKFFVPKDFKPNGEGSLVNSSNIPGNIKQGWGVIYNYHESYYEHESMNFSAKGQVQTADGRTINIDLSLNISRSFAYSNSISFRAGDAVMVDPLLINFGNTSVQLTDTKFEFDLDMDGVNDLISFPTMGSGFIALDLNGDGIINDGSELFGAKTGDGFSELSKYDSDNNGWIDENDPIYDKLRIWTKDENGNDQLFALGQKGIGAIYLGNVNTDYSLKNSENATKGEIKKTGIYLNENGTVGTVQHIDIAL